MVLWVRDLPCKRSTRFNPYMVIQTLVGVIPESRAGSHFCMYIRLLIHLNHI